MALNCAALPDGLEESELFGIEKGVATSVEHRIGKFEQAQGGTLFLDEIGNLGLAAQAKNLQVLQERLLERVGGRTPLQVDGRVIVATSQNLEAALKCRFIGSWGEIGLRACQDTAFYPVDNLPRLY